MLFDFNITQMVAFSISLLGAAYIRGYSGFGFSAIVITCATFYTDPRAVVPIVLASEILMTLVQFKGIRAHIDRPRVSMMTLGAFITLPLSIWLLFSISLTQAQLIVLSLVFLMSILLLMGWRFKSVQSKRAYMGAGLLSGLCNGLGVGGLPIAAFLTGQPIAPAQLRANVIIYLALLDLMTLPYFFAYGAISVQTVFGMLFALPILYLGIRLGEKRFSSASPDAFKRFAIGVLIALSTLGLLRLTFLT